MFETWHAFSDLHVDPYIRADKITHVVLLNDLIREEIQGEFYGLVSGHGGDVVETFDVQRHKPGIRV